MPSTWSIASEDSFRSIAGRGSTQSIGSLGSVALGLVGARDRGR